MNTQDTGSILDCIYEKTANVEALSHTQTINKHIQDALKIQAKRERTLRESTLTFKLTEDITHQELMDTIEKWTDRYEQLAPTFWQDKLHSYCQFDNKDTKVALIEHMMAPNSNKKLRNAMLPANTEGLHYTRRAAKIELPNVKSNINLDIIKKTLDLASSLNDNILDVREGKPHAITKARSVFFRASAANIKHLFGNLNGLLPYNNKATNTRTRLQMRINIKPWQCRDCFKFGQHQCQGRKCGQCGQGGHTNRECKSKTKFCGNCNAKGHKAKEPHCPSYLFELVKEIRKLDIPLEFYEDKEMRFVLAQHLQIK